MDYFLISPEGWSISEQRFTELLAARWPATRFTHVANPGDAPNLEFQLPMEESTLHGRLNAEGSAVISFGALRDCATFALWYRSRLPPEAHPLLFCDEGFNRSLPLQEDTTVDTILQAFGYAPPA